jgi:hypothetical protein
MSLAESSSADLSASERLIGRLAQLAAQDREWILARLSAGAKANLLRHLDQGETTQITDRPRTLDDERVLDNVEGETVARYLAGEPSWVVALILSLRAWRWEQPVLMKLPPVARLEVNQLRHSLPRPSAAMRSLVTRTLREQLATSPAGPRFEDLLDQVRDRAP